MKNIKCRNCFFYRNEWCKKIVDSPDPEEARDCNYFREMTNADRIRAMTDEELAAFINRIVICHHLRNAGNCEKCPIHPAKPCDTEGIAEWLQQPAESTGQKYCPDQKEGDY